MARLIIDNYHEFDEEVQFISKKTQIEKKLDEISSSISVGSEVSVEAIQGVKDDVANIQSAMSENADLDSAQADAIAKNEEAIAEIQDKGFVTAEDVEGMGFVKSEDIPDAPSLDGYATEEWVEKKGYVQWDERSGRKHIVLNNHNNIIAKGTDGGEYNVAMVSKWNVADFGSSAIHLNLNSIDKVTINDIESVATESWANGKFLTAEAVAEMGFLAEHQSLEDYAKSEDIPDADAIKEMGFLTEHQSLEDYAKKEDLPEVPSLDGYATEEWVEGKNYLTEHQSLEDYAKKEDLPTLDDCVKWDVRGERKHVVLDNHNNLIGKGTDGGEYNIAMISKWDVADFGSSALHLNLNSVDKVTVNDSESVATESWVNDKLAVAKRDSDGLAKTIDALLNKITELEKQHEDMPTSIVALNKSLDGDYVPTNGELYLINSVVEGEKGNSNAKVAIDATDIVIDNVTVTSSDENPIYNVFEQKQVSENVKVFNASNVSVPEMKLAHNVFNLYNLEDDAVITIKDCDLNLDPSKSNVIRLSNYSNASNVVVNLENVNWTYENASLPDDSDDWVWAGLIHFQAAGADASLSGDTQYIDTWKFNFKNCKYNGELVTDANFGNNQHNQVIYFYNIGDTKQISLEAVELKFYDADGSEV